MHFNPQLFKVSIIQTKRVGPLDFELLRFHCIYLPAFLFLLKLKLVLNRYQLPLLLDTHVDRIHKPRDINKEPILNFGERKWNRWQIEIGLRRYWMTANDRRYFLSIKSLATDINPGI